jgi:hypothetical protein
VARAEIVEDVDAAELTVTVHPTALPRCDRCWTHRPDVDSAGLCGRCRDVLARSG